MTSAERFRRGNFLLIGVSIAVTGCLGPLARDDHDVYRTPPEGLREIDTVKLDELSRTEPVSVEDAAAAATHRGLTIEQPPTSIELNLADVRAAALENNLDLEVELVSPSISRETVNEEEAQFEALLFGSARWDREDRPSPYATIPGARSRQTSFDTGVRIPLRTGGTVTVNVPFGKYDDDTLTGSASGDGAVPVNPMYQAGLEFSISQPLLRNAGIRTNTHLIRVAKYQSEITDARTKLEAIRILAYADTAYWLLYAARRELEIRQEQYELALQQRQEAQQRVDAGASPEIEIMRADSGVAARLEAIIVADTEVRRRERDLKRILNRPDLPMSAATGIIPATDPNPVGLDLDAEALADYAIEHRMELLELELQLAIDASTVDYERNGILPVLNLDYIYSVNTLKDSYHDALSGLGGHEFADYAAGLAAEIPLGNEAARSRYRRARLQRIQDLATRDRLRLAIRQEVYDAVDQLEQNWQRILAARQEVILAGRTYDGEKRQFEVGLRTSTEVLEADARLAGAKSREIRALAAYEIAQIDIAYATGALLGRGGVIWAPTELED
jgi:outer membrane protein TolC